MKLSELIRILQQELEVSGDEEVYIRSARDDSDLESVSGVERCTHAESNRFVPEGSLFIDYKER